MKIIDNRNRTIYFKEAEVGQYFYKLQDNKLGSIYTKTNCEDKNTIDAFGHMFQTADDEIVIPLNVYLTIY